MICPACGATLEEERTSSYRVHQCPQCKGYWCGPGEAVSFAKVLSAQMGYIHQDYSSRTNPLHVPTQDDRQRTRLCPQCGSNLDLVNYAYNSNVFVDKCPSCDGMWADHGEMAVLAQYIQGSPQMQERGEALVNAFVPKPSPLRLFFTWLSRWL